MGRILLPVLIIFASIIIGACSEGSRGSSTDRAKVYISPHNFNDSLLRLRRSLNTRQLKVFSEIDHSQAAREAGFDLDRNYLVIFGNPKIGTAIMEQNPQMGLELPMKALIYEVDGQVHLRLTDMKALARAYGLNDESGPVANVALALDMIGQEVVAP